MTKDEKFYLFMMIYNAAFLAKTDNDFVSFGAFLGMTFCGIVFFSIRGKRSA